MFQHYVSIRFKTFTGSKMEPIYRQTFTTSLPGLEKIISNTFGIHFTVHTVNIISRMAKQDGTCSILSFCLCRRLSFGVLKGIPEVKAFDPNKKIRLSMCHPVVPNILHWARHSKKPSLRTGTLWHHTPNLNPFLNIHLDPKDPKCERHCG